MHVSFASAYSVMKVALVFCCATSANAVMFKIDLFYFLGYLNFAPVKRIPDHYVRLCLSL